jgi:NAD(P)-dependent dehydrogenase (short-subunit alcohol dehydrogenase family)
MSSRARELAGVSADLAGQVAVVTGAARGLGREMALALGRSGARVVLVGRSTAAAPNRVLPGTLDEVEHELEAIGGHGLVVPADVSTPEGVERVATATQEHFGRCDLLVNNAAVSFIGPFLDVPVSKWRAAIGVNLLAPVMLAHALLPAMLDQGSGRILNIGSGAATSDGVLQLPYGVTKLALERLTTGLAHQLTGTGVGVNCIRVDEVVPTEAVSRAAPELAGGARSTPQDFAQAALWVLARPGWFTGLVLTMEQLRDLGALPR